jgi:hypothetical protein
MEPIKRIVKVTIEKEIEVELTPEMFDGHTIDEYLADFSKGMWDVSNIDEIVKYAASCAAESVGRQEDGLGLVNFKGSTYPRKGDVVVDILSDEIECEII